MIQATIPTTSGRTETNQPVRPATRQALDLTGRSYLSFSQVSGMRRCPQQFAFRYTDPVEPDFVPEALKFGGAIHAALETYYQARLEGIVLGHGELHHPRV